MWVKFFEPFLYLVQDRLATVLLLLLQLLGGVVELLLYVLIDVAQAALQVLIGGFERVILLDHLADLVLELPAFCHDGA